MLKHALHWVPTNARRVVKWMLQGTVCAALMTFSAGGLSAADKTKWTADAARGQRLSETLCASCHIVHADRTKQVVAGVPSFRTIKELPDQRISGVLIRPHTPMPNMQLSRNEIADILAYIEALRRKAQGKPAQPAEKPRPKPTYPSPS